MRVGLELELLAPPGSSREALARALARATKKPLEFGFKFHGAGFLTDGRADCRLTEALRVPGLASFVDDPSISVTGHALPRWVRGRSDDVRIALWAERRCWSRSRAQRLAPFRTDFDALLITRRVLDPLGHPLLLLEDDDAGRERVCEVVLLPLARATLKKTLRLVCSVATDLGFTVPREGATHAHFDAKPFRSTRALRALVLAFTEQRAALMAQLQPNPHCTKVGPFPADVVRVAREADDALDFDTLCAALSLAGLRREVDLNLLGVVEKFPKQPTLEFRALPSTLDADATLERLAALDAFLKRIG